MAAASHLMLSLLVFVLSHHLSPLKCHSYTTDVITPDSKGHHSDHKPLQDSLVENAPRHIGVFTLDRHPKQLLKPPEGSSGNTKAGHDAVKKFDGINAVPAAGDDRESVADVPTIADIATDGRVEPYQGLDRQQTNPDNLSESQEDAEQCYEIIDDSSDEIYLDMDDFFNTGDLNGDDFDDCDEEKERCMGDGQTSIISSDTARVHFKEIILTCSLVDKIADCSRRHLKTVPKDLPGNIETLDLDFNGMTTLEDYAFQNYPALLNLTIAQNFLSRLSNNTFANLCRLKKLNLWGNYLVLNEDTYPDNIFAPLKSLVRLRINRNNINMSRDDLKYPDRALSSLINLRRLDMDGVYGKFGPGFQNLTKLTSLRLAGYNTGYCKIFALHNDTFVNVPSLKYLSLQDCWLQGENIEAGAFEPLVNLSMLSLTHNERIGIKNVKKIFYGLRNSRLEYLFMQLIVNRYSVGICLNHEDIEYFPRYLRHFDAQENNIVALDRHVIENLAPSLETLELSGNKFVFGTYLKDLSKLGNLTKLYLNASRYDYRIPVTYPFKPSTVHAADTPDSECNVYNSDNNLQKPEAFILELPPKLETLTINDFGLTYIFSKLVADENNTLRSLSIHGNRFSKLQGPVIGLNSLLYLDLSNNDVRHIQPTFFQNLTSLEDLHLGTNVLSQFFAHNESVDVFSSLQNLKFLNISSNNIYYMVPGVLDQLENLTYLVLNDNPLVSFTVNVTGMSNLRYLNLMYTRVSFLSYHTMHAIDSLIRSGVHTRVYMERSSIKCDCTNLRFLKWMTACGAFNKSFTNYVCIYQDSSTKSITDGYAETISILEGECTSHVLMFLIVASATAAVLFLILGLVIYRFRWKIRYLYYGAYLYYRKLNRDQKDDFEYDVFICYAHEDEPFVLDAISPEFENRGLKLLIHGRDFAVGDYIASNIVQAVCKSRRTLVVLTRHMMNSYWCSYEIQMAKWESVHKGRPVLMFLILETIPESELGVDLLYNIHNNTYIPYPESPADTASMKLMWDKLASDLRTG